jgi:hypothetical protein
MRRLVIAMFSAGLVTAATAGADAAVIGPPRAHVTVSPALGKASTRFRVRFTSPEQTGTLAGLRAWETVVASGPRGTGTCTGLASRRARPAGAHTRLAVRLAPAGRPWCAGRYTGTVTLYRVERCMPGPIAQGHVCPLVEFAPQPIGRFRFTVRRGAPRAR